MQQKLRLLIPISFSFSIRFLYRTGMLHKLSEFVTPVIVITWNQEDLVEELKKDGFEVHVIEPGKKNGLYADTRTKIDFYFRQMRLKSPSKDIQLKYLDQYLPIRNVVIRRLRKRYNHFKFLFPKNRNEIFELEKALLKSHTNFSDMLQFVEQLQIDAVYTPTPFQDQEDILLRACKQKGKFMIASILSFDNVTKRGWIPVDYDVYMVWNKYNYNEMLRAYSAAKPQNTFITGAAQFDFYFNEENLFKKSEWEEMVGLQNNKRKIILYAGGPKSLFPNEMQYVKHLDDAIKDGTITGNPIILFRCHPIDNVERWKDYIGPSDNIVYDVSWTGSQKMQYANITDSDIKKLCSTLAFTDVHVNLISTMAVDGSAYNKPQVGPAYDEVNQKKQHLLQRMYRQEHYLPILNSKGLLLSESKEQLANHVNNALQNPSAYISKSEKILDEIITYRDGKCTDRVVDIIRQSIEEKYKSKIVLAETAN